MVYRNSSILFILVILCISLCFSWWYFIWWQLLFVMFDQISYSISHSLPFFSLSPFSLSLSLFLSLPLLLPLISRYYVYLVVATCDGDPVFRPVILSIVFPLTTERRNCIAVSESGPALCHFKYDFKYLIIFTILEHNTGHFITILWIMAELIILIGNRPEKYRLRPKFRYKETGVYTVA